MASASTTSLQQRLALALSTPVRLWIHHIVSEPFSCPELFPAPPGQDSEPTLCESHFLSASTLHNGHHLHVFGVEVLVYSTESLTTLFVSKADSTGYLRLLNLPKGIASPIKTVISTFLEYLIETKRRKDARLVLSLFARAQNQYLFPGSVENKDKHVLDDRGLIKWWCRVANPLLECYSPSQPSPNVDGAVDSLSEDTNTQWTAHAHIVVPGCDPYETRAYFPRTRPPASGEVPRWRADDPLERLGKASGLPPRCYIPRFPDDPKARFVIDLDDELPDEAPGSEAQPPKGRQMGRWRSVRSLPQFWEMMAYRQECAAGRLVGFLWVVIEPILLKDKPLVAKTQPSENDAIVIESQGDTAQLPTPQDSQNVSGSVGTVAPPLHPPSSPALRLISETLLSPLSSSQPQPSSQADGEVLKGQEGPSSPSRSLPPSDQPLLVVMEGARILSDPAYKRVMEILERTDYASLELATESTKTFLSAVAQELDLPSLEWGYEVVSNGQCPSNVAAVKSDSKAGTSSADNFTVQNRDGSAQTLGAGLIRKKKRPAEDVVNATQQPASVQNALSEPKALGMGIVRKKPKV